MTSIDFQYPTLFDFPPFFTYVFFFFFKKNGNNITKRPFLFSRQITDSTWKSQVSQWETFILDYTRQKHLFRLELHQATSPGGIEIFENKKINRRLSFETLQDIIEEMTLKGIYIYKN